MLRILIAEDNLINQKVVMTMLDKFGYSAEIVCDGEQAVTAARKTAYDVILMDVMMPILNGMEATRQIRADESSAHRAHIIALTANAMNGDRSKCLDAGMDDFISKPFILETLRAGMEAAEQACLSTGSDAAEHSGQSAGSDAISESHLRSLIETMGDDDPTFITELLTDYLLDAERMRIELHNALDEGDTSTVEHIGHTLKSSSAVFGALLLVDICEDFEHYGKRGDLEEVRVRLPHFDGALRDVHNALSRVAETGLL